MRQQHCLYTVLRSLHGMTSMRIRSPLPKNCVKYYRYVQCSVMHCWFESSVFMLEPALTYNGTFKSYGWTLGYRVR